MECPYEETMEVITADNIEELLEIWGVDNPKNLMDGQVKLFPTDNVEINPKFRPRIFRLLKLSFKTRNVKKVIITITIRKYDGSEVATTTTVSSAC